MRWLLDNRHSREFCTGSPWLCSFFFRFEEPPSEDKAYIVLVDLSESEDDGIDLCESEDDDIDLSEPEDDGEHVLKAS